MAEFHIPSDVEVRGMMGLLYDGLTVVAGPPVSGTEDGDIVGTYIDANDQLAAVCVCDISCAAFASSSLTMIPKGGAEDAVATKELTPGMMDNLGEVMNIISRVFIREGTPHLRYDKIYPKSEISDEVRNLIDVSAGRIDLALDIPRYGLGNISLVSR